MVFIEIRIIYSTLFTGKNHPRDLYNKMVQIKARVVSILAHVVVVVVVVVSLAIGPLFVSKLLCGAVPTSDRYLSVPRICQ